jgi:ADP-heptose:LPS heptosyltransferase
MHQVERNLRLVEALGFVARDRDLSIYIPDEARVASLRLLARAGIDPAQPYILLHPGASAKARRYPLERSGEVAQLLVQRGWQVLVTGVEREAPLLETVAQHAPGARFLVGKTTLPEYAALIEGAALVVCGNTLPLHLADALGTPLVVLYSGTDLETQWQPRRTSSRILRRPTPCYPCYLFECPIGQPCLDILPAEVVDAGECLLAEAHSLKVIA